MRALLLIAAIILTGAPGAHSGTPADGAQAALGDMAVAVQTFQFRPKILEIPVGASVIWTNADEIEHTVTSGAPDSTDARFGGQLAAKGSTFSFTFNRAGSYRYFCNRHQFMRGEIRVTQQGDHQQP